MFEVAKITYEDALYVAQNMREQDRREINAWRVRDDDWEGLAKECVELSVFAFVAKKVGQPVAVLGAYPQAERRGVWSVYRLTTDRWPEISYSLSKQAKEKLLPVLRHAAGVHRVECYSMAGNEDTHSWIEWCGLKPEPELYQRGKNGENFIRFSKTWETPACVA